LAVLNQPNAKMLQCQICIARIHAGFGWAVHEIVSKFEDGHRSGIILENSCSPRLNDVSGVGRLGTLYEVKEPGDYITSISGHNLSDGTPSNLCHTPMLQFASGQKFLFASGNNSWARK
jgi:hypothetical protein